MIVTCMVRLKDGSSKRVNIDGYVDSSQIPLALETVKKNAIGARAAIMLVPNL